MNIQAASKTRASSMSIEDFFGWIEHQDRKYELVEGVPRLQPYVRLNHNRIVVAVTGLLLAQLDPAEFEITIGDFAVETGPTSIRFADIMIIPAGKSGKALRVTDAVVLVEVLSEGTMHVDFGAKLSEYRKLPDLATYLIFDQNAPRVWQWTRDDDGEWPADPQVSTEGHLNLSRPPVQFLLDRIYRQVKPGG